MYTLTTRRGAAVLAATGALLLSALVALASAPQAEAGTIYACVKKKTGAARFVTKAAKCRKGETRLTWNTQGPAGNNGAKGLNGINGTNGIGGLGGKEGATGPRGPGVVASGNLGGFGFESCELLTGENHCFNSSLAFTPSANAQCLVSVSSQIGTFGAGKPVVNGPFFRIAIKTGATEGDDEAYGFYFMGTAGPKSTVLERTRLIPVKAGTTYNFGAFYGFPEGEWEKKTANFEVSYICFGS